MLVDAGRFECQKCQVQFSSSSVLSKQFCTVPFITRKASDSPWQVLCTHSLAIFFPWVECLAGCTLAFGRYEENMKPQTIIHPEAWDLRWMSMNHSRGLLCFFPNRERRYFWRALYRHWNPTKKTGCVTRKCASLFCFRSEVYDISYGWWKKLPVDMVNIPLFTATGFYKFYTSQTVVVWDFWTSNQYIYIQHLPASSSLESPRSANTHGESRRPELFPSKVFDAQTGKKTWKLLILIVRVISYLVI